MSAVKSCLIPDGDGTCGELVDYLQANDGSRLFITYPSLINDTGEVLWLQAVLNKEETFVVYTNGDVEYQPDFFPLLVDALDSE